MLAVFSNGTFYTTSFDLSNRYQGDVIIIEKLDLNKTYTAIYYDGAAKAYYVKRFSFPVCDNTPTSFISDAPKSKLVAIVDDLHPQFLVTFGGKSEHREPEAIDAEEWIAKKGINAKGKKCHEREIKKVEFIEPLNKPATFDIETEPGEEAISDLPDLNIEEPTLF